MTKRPDRRALILDAAITEFAERGFVSASTNAIAEAAGVAKGLVFHHFGDKDALFLAAVADMANVIDPYFVDAFDDAPRDLIGRVLVLLEKKIAFLRDEPRATRFLMYGLADAPPAVRKKARALLDPSGNALIARMLDGVDATVLRDGISVTEATEALMLLAAGLEKRNEALTDTLAKAKRFDVDGAVAYSKRMLALLRGGLYR